MPWIRHQLEVFLGKPPCSSIDPDEVRVVSLLSRDLTIGSRNFAGCRSVILMSLSVCLVFVFRRDHILIREVLTSALKPRTY